MAESIQIKKGPPAEPSKDFALLREKGMEIIRQLAQDTWTDHNLTDPGITTLEVLAYAITELGHRSQFDIKDLLASSPSTADSAFFPATQALTVHPITVDDIRKILIDQEGIRNAWVQKSPNYKPAFSYDQSLGRFCLGVSGNNRIDLKGLYDVLLEFEEDPNLGDLNQSIFSRTIEINADPGGFKYVTLEVGFPFLDDEEMLAWRKPLSFTSVAGVDGPEVTLIEAEGGIDYIADLVINYNDGSPQMACVRVSLRLTSIEPLSENEKTALFTKINEVLTKIPASGNGNAEDCLNDGSLVYCYNQKVIKIHQILNELDRRMGSFRNLCEIFFQFQVARIQEVSVQTNLDVGPEADVERLLAEIYFEIDQFLAPYARQRSLSYMQEELGLLNEQIFEGPTLDHGFIDIDELQQIPSTTERKVIRTSDLVNLIMSLRSKDIEIDDRLDLPINRNIIAVSRLALSNYIENQLICEDITDCLALVQDGQYLPRLSIGKSEISVFRDGIEVPYNNDLVVSHFLLLKRQALLAEEATGPFELEVETGKIYDFQDYYSIQEDFPRTYGIGAAGLADNESDERKAQAIQFQGFLYFFEQLLANFFSQLSHVQDFFAISSDQTQSYFYQELNKLPGISYLLAGVNSHDTAWNSFLADTNNIYVQKLLSANESTDVFLNRRHRVLDHLMARFAENMEEYVLVKYSIGLRGVFNPLAPNYNVFNAARQALSRQLIADKECFMQDYAEIGYERNKASNIQIGHTFDQLFFTKGPGNSTLQHQWSWQDRSGVDRIHGFNNVNEVTYGSRQAAEDAAHEAIKLGTFTPATAGTDIGYFHIHTIDNGSNDDTFFYTISNKRDPSDSDNEILARSKTDFNSQAEAEADIRELGALLRDVWKTDNVSNLEKRLSRLLGFKRLGRHRLSTPFETYFSMFFSNPGNTDGDIYKLQLSDDSGEVLLSSSADYDAAEPFPFEDIKSWISAGLNRENYAINTDGNLELRNKNGGILATQNYGDATVASAALDATLACITRHYGREGFHLVEHILLRPRQEDATLADPPFLHIPKGEDELVLDAYSFRLTFIFPTGCDRDFAAELEDTPPAADQPALFQDNYWKQFVEKTIRKETPAHIYPEIFWLDTERSPEATADYLQTHSIDPLEREAISLNHFEQLFEDWLQISAHYDDGEDISLSGERVAAKKALIDLINKLYTQ